MKLLKGKGIAPDMGIAHRCLSWAALWAFPGPASVLAAGEGVLERGSSECYSQGQMLRAGTEDCGRVGHGCWQNGATPPVLKHGPRSLTSMRVFGCETRTRNESERRSDPLPSGRGARSTDPDVYRKDLSRSIAVGTRKMVNYA
ncbi:MAG: hypothetical protein DUD35_14170 [Lactobacillus sp.]|nr:MAG: hypothetical protein DUD35_14170 [Lactobacillus sp.]